MIPGKNLLLLLLITLRYINLKTNHLLTVFVSKVSFLIQEGKKSSTKSDGDPSSSHLPAWVAAAAE